MNSVLLGVDFVVKNDNISLLEMNTDINISYTKLPQFDFESLFNYITGNSFSTLHLVYKSENVSVAFVDVIKDNCTANGITYEDTIVPLNSVVIPQITDSESKLIMRLAYSSQAILDDTYCRDKNELINLIFENGQESIIPKTYTVYGSVVRDNLTGLTDNGNIPNLIVKKQLPDFNKTTYPAFYKLDTNEELATIKSTLSSGLFIQDYEYSTDNVEQSTIINHIRQWFLVSNEMDDIIQCGGYLHSNNVQLDETLITYTNDKLDNMGRYMLFSNPNRTSFEGVPSDYLVTKVNEDTTMVDVSVSNIAIGDTVQALIVGTLDGNFTRLETLNWVYTGSTENFLSYTTASVISVLSKPVEDWFNRIEYSNNSGTGSSLLPVGKLVLVQDLEGVKFKNVDELSVGNILFNSPTMTSEITSINNEYFSGSMVMIDIEPSDVFVAGTNTNEILNTLVVHNQCPYQK
jgi:hypothetical protein